MRGLAPVRGILERLRGFRSPPGRPAEGLGVPSAGEDLERELAPVFALLEPIEAEAERTLAAGRRRAAAETALGARVAGALRDAAQAGAPRVRRRAAAGRVREAERAARALADEGDREAARVRERGAAGIPGVVEAVLDDVRAAAGGGPG